MKIGNIVHRARIEPISLAFHITLLRLPDVTTLPTPVYVAPCLRGQRRLLHSSPGIVSLLMLTMTYIQVMTLHNTYIG